MKQILSLIMLTGIYLFITSCGTSVESQQKYWDSNVQSINQLMSKFPSLKTFLDEELKSAESIMAEAKSISNDEQKMKKMQDANGIFSAGLMQKIKDAESKIESSQKKRTELKDKNLVEDQKNYANEALNDAKHAAEQAEQALKQNYSTKSEAIAAITSAINKIDDSIKEIDRIISKNSAKQDEINQNKASEDSVKKAQEKAKQPIKCEYCGTMNEPTETRCKSCGASLEKK